MNVPFFSKDEFLGEIHFYPVSLFQVALYVKSNKELRDRFVKFLISDRDEF